MSNTTEIKFRYTCVKPTPFIFHRDFTIEEIESGSVTTWIERNYANAAVIHRRRFTGLQDKNRKDCYVSDFIKDHNGRIYECKMLDTWLEIFFEEVPKGISLTPYGLLINGGKFEIIGNIYENPQLLNSEQNPERSVNDNAG